MENIQTQASKAIPRFHTLRDHIRLIISRIGSRPAMATMVILPTRHNKIRKHLQQATTIKLMALADKSHTLNMNLFTNVLRLSNLRTHMGITTTIHKPNSHTINANTPVIANPSRLDLRTLVFNRITAPKTRIHKSCNLKYQVHSLRTRQLLINRSIRITAHLSTPDLSTVTIKPALAHSLSLSLHLNMIPTNLNTDLRAITIQPVAVVHSLHLHSRIPTKLNRSILMDRKVPTATHLQTLPGTLHHHLHQLHHHSLDLSHRKTRPLIIIIIPTRTNSPILQN